ncbi:MAG: hypothetical protein AMXMBFR16_10740 [Candidatus Uhrbacteria bacterium]
MKKPQLRAKHGPEFGIQGDIIRMLTSRGWHIERLTGNAFQSGLPDLLAGHPKYGMRFIEVKQEEGYRFTKQQKWKFPVLMDYGMGIWVLTEATPEQYDRLFKPPNLWDYLDRSECPNQEEVDEIVDHLAQVLQESYDDSELRGED